MSYISIESLSKVYGSVSTKVSELLQKNSSSEQIKNETGQLVSLNNINLTINQGEFHVIMGLSGSGKSTLLRHLNGLLKPTLGHIIIDGEDITQFNDKQTTLFRQQKVSMVFQHYGLFPHYNVVDNVAFGLLVQQNWQRCVKIDNQVHEWIERVGLHGFEQAYPDELSGGMQQRVGLARALAIEADIILLDEAFSGLDPLIRREMQDLLLNLETDMKKTIIFITHDLNEALKLGDMVTILHQGQIAQTDTPINILQKPANQYVKQFVEDVNRTAFITAGNIKKSCIVVSSNSTPHEAIRQMQAQDMEDCFIVEDQKVQGVVSLERLIHSKGATIIENSESVITVYDDSVLDEVLPFSLKSKLPIAVINNKGQVLGKLSREDIITALTN